MLPNARSGAMYECNAGGFDGDPIFSGHVAQQLPDGGKTSERPEHEPEQEKQQDKPGSASGNPVSSRDRPGQAGRRTDRGSDQRDQEDERNRLPYGPTRQPHHEKRREHVTGEAGDAKRRRRTGDERGQGGAPSLLSDSPRGVLRIRRAFVAYMRHRVVPIPERRAG
jgi:hypothetical protein